MEQTVRPVENFCEFIWVKVMTVAGEQNLRRMAVLHFIFYVTIKRGGISGLHEIHRWLGRWEEAKWRNLWNEIEKNRDTLVCIGELTVNNEHVNSGTDCVLTGLGKKANYFDIPKVC